MSELEAQLIGAITEGVDAEDDAVVDVARAVYGDWLESEGRLDEARRLTLGARVGRERDAIDWDAAIALRATLPPAPEHGSVWYERGAPIAAEVEPGAAHPDRTLDRLVRLPGLRALAVDHGDDHARRRLADAPLRRLRWRACSQGTEPPLQPGLRALDLSFPGRDPRLAAASLDALVGLPELRALALDQVGPPLDGDHWAERLERAAPRLEQLTIGRCPDDGLDGLDALADLPLRALRLPAAAASELARAELSPLEALDIDVYPLSVQGGPHTEELAALIARHPLRRLGFRDVDGLWSPGPAQLRALLAEASGLRAFSLRTYHASPLPALERLPDGLRELALAATVGIDVRSLEGLRRLTSLERLRLPGFLLPDAPVAALGAVLAGLPRLVALEVSLGTLGSGELLPAVGRAASLRALTVELRPRVAERPGAWRALSALPRLEHLILERCVLGEDLRPPLPVAVVRAIADLPALRRLTIVTAGFSAPGTPEAPARDALRELSRGGRVLVEVHDGPGNRLVLPSWGAPMTRSLPMQDAWPLSGV